MWLVQGFTYVLTRKMSRVRKQSVQSYGVLSPIFRLRLWPSRLRASSKRTQPFSERIRFVFLHGTVIWNAVMKNWKSLSFERSAKEFSTWCWDCKIFREIFRESGYATLDRRKICCNLTLLNDSLNSSFVSKPRWTGFSITGTSRRTRIRIFSGNNAKGKDSYQHRRHRPRRLWQVHHNWPFDLQMWRNRQTNHRKVREGGPRGKLRVVVFNVSLASDFGVHRRTIEHSLKFSLSFPGLWSIFLP